MPFPVLRREERLADLRHTLAGSPWPRSSRRRDRARASESRHTRSAGPRASSAFRISATSDCTICARERERTASCPRGPRTGRRARRSDRVMLATTRRPHRLDRVASVSPARAGAGSSFSDRPVRDELQIGGDRHPCLRELGLAGSPRARDRRRRQRAVSSCAAPSAAPAPARVLAPRSSAQVSIASAATRLSSETPAHEETWVSSARIPPATNAAPSPHVGLGKPARGRRARVGGRASRRDQEQQREAAIATRRSRGPPRAEHHRRQREYTS